MAGGIPWSQTDVERLVSMARAGKMFNVIAGDLGRNHGAVRSKFQEYARSLKVKQRKALWAERDKNLELPVYSFWMASPEQTADRARRQNLGHHDITAAFFGDPLPGQSALDQRGSSL